MTEKESTQTYNRLFSELVQRNLAKVRHYCVRKTVGHHEDVPDIVQDIVVRLWERRDEMPVDGGAKQQDKWVMGQARNEVARYRRRRRFRVYPLEQVGQVPGEMTGEDIKETLQEYLAMLSPYEREVLGKELEGYTQKEIAESLGLKASTLRKQRERIIKKIIKTKNKNGTDERT